MKMPLIFFYVVPIVGIFFLHYVKIHQSVQFSIHFSFGSFPTMLLTVNYLMRKCTNKVISIIYHFCP